RKQLHELGYIEGKNLVIDWRYSDEGTARLSILAEELVGQHPDVLISITTPATAAVKAAAGGIPVVFSIVGDPVATGFVASLAQPGGNMTGQSIVAVDLSGKRLELLREIPQPRPWPSFGIRRILPFAWRGMRPRMRRCRSDYG